MDFRLFFRPKREQHSLDIVVKLQNYCLGEQGDVVTHGGVIETP